MCIRDRDDATLALAEAEDKLAEQLAETSGQWDIGTEAGRDNYEQAIDSAGAIRDMELALIGNGTAAEDARALTDVYREGLRQTLLDAGLTETAVDELMETYGEVPAEVSTAMEADTQLAHFAALNYRAALSGIPGRIVTRAEIDYALYDPGRHGGGAGRIFERADGGATPAGVNVLVGERGPEVVQLPTRGNVVPNHRLNIGAGGGPQVGELHVNITGTMDFSDPNAARRVAVAIREQLVRLEDETA